MWTPNYNDLGKFQSRSKSPNLNPPMSAEDRRRFEKSDEECLATVYVQTGPQRAKEPLRKPAHSESIFSEKLERVSAMYKTDSDVDAFLLKNNFLFTVLLQAVDHIKAAFGNTEGIALRLLQDGTSTQLFAVIPTKLEPEAAVKKLRVFDENWWMSAPNEIRDFLEFTLEFV